MSYTHTRQTTIALSLIAGSLFSATSHAQSSASAAPSAEITYNLGLVSDYRYRGISQTRLQPAIQGGADLAYGDFYAGAWASNIKWIKDAGFNGSLEFDLYGGYKYALNKNLTLDVGGLMYYFPSNSLKPSANTVELYAGVASGPYSVKYSRSVSNLFGFADSKGSGYLEANVDYELYKGTNVVAHIGRQMVKRNGYANYTDYKIGATREALGGKLALSLVGTNEDFIGGNNKNLSKAGLVAGYTKTF